MTPAQIFDRITSDFDPATAKGIHGTIQFNLSGDDGGSWFVRIADGQVEVGSGTSPTPTMTVAASAADYVDIATGKTPAQVAFMSGKLKLSGDLSLAMRLQGLFKPLS